MSTAFKRPATAHGDPEKGIDGDCLIRAPRVLGRILHGLRLALRAEMMRITLLRSV